MCSFGLTVFRLIVYISVFIFYCFQIEIKAQEVKDSVGVNNAIYATINGLINNNSLVDSIDFEVKFEEGNYLEVGRITNLRTGNRFKDLYKIWALRYNNKYYIHLSNARNINGLKKFMKINKKDARNNFLIFHINGQSPIVPESSGKSVIATTAIAAGIVLALGGAGFVIVPSPKDMKSNNYWKKEAEEWAYIYYIDTKKSLDPKAMLLTKRKLKKLFANNAELHKKIDGNEVLFDEALSLMKRLNK